MQKLQLSAEISVEDITHISDVLRSLGNTVTVEDGILYVQSQNNNPVTDELFGLCREVTDELSGYVALYEKEDVIPVESISLVQKCNIFLGQHFR